MTAKAVRGTAEGTFMGFVLSPRPKACAEAVLMLNEALYLIPGRAVREYCRARTIGSLARERILYRVIEEQT